MGAKSVKMLLGIIAFTLARSPAASSRRSLPPFADQMM